MTDHVLGHLQKHRRNTPTPTAALPPLFVAIQGPQGCGKTYLTSQLHEVLQSPPHSLSVAILSIDDLYLPYTELVSLAEAHPTNALLQGRGLPGTHDVKLAKQILRDLQHINEPSSEGALREVALPSFDKSLHGGAGDRVPSTVAIRPTVDVVVMEGWCVGFQPTTVEEIEKRWDEPIKGLEHRLSMSNYRKKDILEVNGKLKEYVDLWDRFTVCIQVCIYFLTVRAYYLREISFSKDRAGTFVSISIHLQMEIGTGASDEVTQRRGRDGGRPGFQVRKHS